MITNFYGDAAVAVHQAAFGLGTGPVFLSTVKCTGIESSLLSCSHHIGVITFCSHFDESGVVCHPCKPLCKLFSFLSCHMGNGNGFSYHGHMNATFYAICAYV